MDLKLQQAIVATRAGRVDVAQQLLANLISEEPENANAWFLLGHIVEPKDRQIRYLQKAVTLDPENDIARTRIKRLTAPPVPPPVIAKEEKNEQPVRPATRTESKPSTPLFDSPETPPQVVEEPQTPTKLPEWLQDLDDKKLAPQQTAENNGESWPVAAGRPKRESKQSAQKARVLHIPQSHSAPKSANDSRTKEEIWLLRILAILVIVAAIVLAFLVVLILF